MQKGAIMKRDLVYYYDRPLNAVFSAFVQAANQQFGKNCKIDQGKTISFALNYSFKYNMNGGMVTAHFMPYADGVAVNLRYTIVQVFGARYKAHAADLTGYVNNLLQAAGKLIELDIKLFLKYEAETPSVGPILVQSQQTPYVPPEASGISCPRCSALNEKGARFCVGCGFRLLQDPVCKNCGATLSPASNFCPVCGTKKS